MGARALVLVRTEVIITDIHVKVGAEGALLQQDVLRIAGVENEDKDGEEMESSEESSSTDVGTIVRIRYEGGRLVRERATRHKSLRQPPARSTSSPARPHN
jgi:hypothetical protein